MTIKKEIARKLIHLSSIWIPILYLYLDKKFMATTIGIIASIYILSDYLRFKNKQLSKIFSYFTPILRSFEQNEGKLTGASFMLLGSFVVILFATKFVAISALSVLIVADSFAAIVGKKYGKRKIYDKTIEGSLAFYFSGLITCFIISFYFNMPIKTYIIQAVVMIFVTYVELISKRINVDDNFSIPFTFAMTINLFEVII